MDGSKVGRACGGLTKGSIRMWSRSTLDLERTLIGHTYAVSVLVFPMLTPCLFVGRDNWAMQRLAN